MGVRGHPLYTEVLALRGYLDAYTYTRGVLFSSTAS